MKDKTLYMIGNAHIDPVWLWQWQEGCHEVKATFRSALDRMQEYPDFVFVSSSAAFYEWVERSDPAMFAEIRQRVAEGRWQIVGGWWIQPDCNLPSGESFARQALYAQRYFQEKFGVTARVGYNVDSFGHNGMLPQLLKKSGLDYYIFMRPMPHEKALPGRLFWWESDDGSRVLAYRLPYEYCTWGDSLEAHVWRCAAELKPPYDANLCFYGVGNHGGGPTRQNLDSILRMQAGEGYPGLVFSAPERFFEAVLARDLPLPVVHDDLQHHASGCYAAHSGIKRWNRRIENLLVTAEKLAAVAGWTIGQPYPAAEIERAWKDVLFNQFHDILAGTSLEAAYDDARDQYGEAATIAGRVLNEAVQALAWKIRIEPQEKARPLVTFNPHAWRSRANVELELGGLKDGDRLVDDAGSLVAYQRVRSATAANGRSRISFVADLPPLGYRTYRLLPDPGPEQPPAGTEISAGGDWVQASSTCLEDERYRLELDPESGAIASLLDKRAGIEVFCGAAALPVVLNDPSDTWSHNVYCFRETAGCFGAESLRLVEHGPVRATIRVASRYQDSRLVQEFSLFRELEGIHVRARVDWRAGFQALKLRFPLDLSQMRPTAEIPYGHIERPADGQEEPCQSWIDVSGFSRQDGQPYGMSLLNDGKYSYDVSLREIGLTVLRSPIYAHHMPFVPGPEVKEYTFMDQGLQVFSYVLLPHRGSWETAGTVQRAAELNAAPLVLAATFHSEGTLPQSDSFVSVDRENLVISAIKLAEGGDDLILRCVETARQSTQATICLPHWQRLIQAGFGPCEIKTFRVPRDPSRPVVETDLIERDLAGQVTLDQESQQAVDQGTCREPERAGEQNGGSPSR